MIARRPRAALVALDDSRVDPNTEALARVLDDACASVVRIRLRLGRATHEEPAVPGGPDGARVALAGEEALGFGDDTADRAFARLLVCLGADVVHLLAPFPPSFVQASYLVGVPVVVHEAPAVRSPVIASDLARRAKERALRLAALVVAPEQTARGAPGPGKAGDLLGEAPEGGGEPRRLRAPDPADPAAPAFWRRVHGELVGNLEPPDGDDLALSVVVATRDRPELLGRVLAGLSAQTLRPERFEVIVIDDGSQSPPTALVSAFDRSLNLRLLRNKESRGLGEARNTGVAAATGEVVVFLDDDDLPLERCLAEHLSGHLENPEVEVAVLGYRGLHPDAFGPVLTHATLVGMQMTSYPALRATLPLGWHAFWGGVSSAKRALLLEEPFALGWGEDTEWGFRLRKRLRVVFRPRAVQLQLRGHDEGSFLERARAQGRAAYEVVALHPAALGPLGLDEVPRRLAALRQRSPSVRPLDAGGLSALRARPGSRGGSAEDDWHSETRDALELARLEGFWEALWSARGSPVRRRGRELRRALALGALGTSYLEAGRREEAKAVYRRALDAAPFPPPGIVGPLTLLLADDGEAEEARALAAEIEPEDPEGARLIDAAAALGVGEPERALATLAEVGGGSPLAAWLAPEALTARAAAATGDLDRAATASLAHVANHGLGAVSLPGLLEDLLVAGKDPGLLARALPSEALPELCLRLAAMARQPEPLGRARISRAVAADLVLETVATTRPHATFLLAAAADLAPRLAPDRAEVWSGRLRQAGMGQYCPLIAVAADPAESPHRRVEAAARAWAAFEDERAKSHYALALAAAPPGARNALRCLASRISPSLAETGTAHAHELAGRRATLRPKSPAPRPTRPPVGTGPTQAPCRGPRVLVVDQCFEGPWTSSGSRRLTELVRLWRDQGARVAIWSRQGGSAEARELLSSLGVAYFGVDPAELPEAPEERAAFLASARPPLADLLAKGRFDTVVLTPFETVAAFAPLVRRHAPGAVLVADSVDVGFRREASEAELTGCHVDRLRAAARRRRELAAYRLVDRVVCVCEEDAAAIRGELGDVEVLVVPNVHRPAPLGPGFAERNGAVFVGSALHRPNLDALRFFRDEVGPRLAALVPDLRLLVVGYDPAGILRGFAGGPIEVAGSAPDTLPFLHAARVSVAPLRFGAGMKGKVGEALAAGLPVVATSVAAEGMGLSPGRHLLVADGAAAFAEAVARLHTDELLWRRLATEGRRAVLERFGPEAVAGSAAAMVQPRRASSGRAASGGAR